MEKINISKLKEVIEKAEKKLEELERANDKSSHKYKRITKSLEKAYATLNLGDYTQKTIDKRTDEVWEALMDDHSLFLFIFFIGIFLTGAIIFAVYQAFSFIGANNIHNHPHKPVTGDTSLVKVNYLESSIISLYDQLSVDDEIGLQNAPQKFTISNDSKEAPNLDYDVEYQINLMPMNDPHAKLLNVKYIKYQYKYTDKKSGKTYTSSIGTIGDLERNQDGSFKLTSGEQDMDGSTDYEVVFWISNQAGNDQQGSTFTFAFKVEAGIDVD